jgi:hypothetical protein
MSGDRIRRAVERVPIAPAWVGKSISGDGAHEGLRMAMVKAQNYVLDRINFLPGEDLRIMWEIHFPSQEFEWNAQNTVPEGATDLVCIAQIGPDSRKENQYSAQADERERNAQS